MREFLLKPLGGFALIDGAKMDAAAGIPKSPAEQRGQLQPVDIGILRRLLG